MADSQGQDIKKIILIWAIIVISSVITVFLLHRFSLNIVNYIQYPPDNPFLLARSLAEEGEKYYRRCLEKVEKLRPEKDVTGLLKGDADLNQAKSLFLKSLELYPKNTRLYVMLAELASLEGDMAAAHYYAALDRYGNKYYDEALSELALAFKYDPEDMKILEKKAEILIAQKKLEAAEETISMILAKSPEFANAYQLQGRIDFNRQDFEKAIESLRKCLKYQPQHVQCSKDLAIVLNGLGRHDEALQVLKSALQYTTKDASLFHLTGTTYFQQGNYKEALKALKQAEKLEKFSAPLYFDLARVYKQLGRDHMATVMLQKAIELDPTFRDQILSSKK